MTCETTVNVPTRDLRRLARALVERGCLVLDAGERTTPEGALDGEATLHVLVLDAPSRARAERTYL